MSDLDRFDKAAPTWDAVDRRVQLAREVTGAVAARIALSKDMEVLDFGCGTGLVTLALGPLVGSVTGADTSAGMLLALAEKARSQGVSVHLKNLDADGGASLGGPYDLIVSSMTLHHVADVPALFRRFGRHLIPGGQVALADLDAEDGTFHEDSAGVHHKGFLRDQVQGWLAEAGFRQVELETAAVTSKAGRDYSVFLATAYWG